MQAVHLSGTWPRWASRKVSTTGTLCEYRKHAIVGTCSLRLKAHLLRLDARCEGLNAAVLEPHELLQLFYFQLHDLSGAWPGWVAV